MRGNDEETKRERVRELMGEEAAVVGMALKFKSIGIPISTCSHTDIHLQPYALAATSCNPRTCPWICGYPHEVAVEVAVEVCHTSMPISLCVCTWSFKPCVETVVMAPGSCRDGQEGPSLQTVIRASL